MVPPGSAVYNKHLRWHFLPGWDQIGWNCKCSAEEFPQLWEVWWIWQWSSTWCFTFPHLTSNYWRDTWEAPERNVQSFYQDFNWRFQLEEEIQSVTSRTHASVCRGLWEITHLLRIAWVNQCAVLSDGIMDKDDSAAFLSLRLFPWRPLEPNKSYHLAKACPAWLIDLHFFKENSFHTFGCESKGSWTYHGLWNTFSLPTIFLLKN